MQGLSEEKGRFDIEVHHLVPAVFGKLIEISGPSRPGVVDQDVEVGLALINLVGEGLAAGEARNVLRQRDAGSELGELPRRCVTGVRFTRRDIDLRPALNE